MSLVHDQYIFVGRQDFFKDNTVLDQNHFCIEVFLEGIGTEIRSESDPITSVCCGGECDLKEERR